MAVATFYTEIVVIFFDPERFYNFTWRRSDLVNLHSIGLDVFHSNYVHNLLSIVPLLMKAELDFLIVFWQQNP